MDKLWLIIRREYLTRVMRRSFILTTILTPLAFVVFFIVVGFIMQYQSDDVKRVAIIDQADILKGSIKDERNLYFKFVDTELEVLRRDFDQFDYDGILLIPPVNDLMATSMTVFYYSEEQPTLDIESLIRERVRLAIRDYKIDQLKLEREQLAALETRVSLEPEPIEESGVDASKLTGAIGAAIGGIMGVVMYMAVFIYGMMVMRSVMEEKTNRIVEVMISSVRPFQLMLGKIVGVGAVGLTQLAIWLILLPAIFLLTNLIFGFDTNSMEQLNSQAAQSEIDPDDMQALAAMAIQEFRQQNWWLIIPLFIVFFLGGYLLYSSLFAAVGSAMGDDLGEGQALTLPITIPVLLAFYIMFAAVQAPNSSLAVWSSIFPLFSPIVMPARLAFGPPAWQIALSVLLLIGASLLFVWISGRIYRIGILLYGKKVTIKELGKWMFYKD